MNVNPYPYLFQQGDKTVEVVLTGRTASKKRGSRDIILHEIESADKDLGFKQWVRLDQLFTIDTTK
ncbi:hypothetical protein LCGC14_3086940 [marine sediment metagenome]|uniref:Uncharacterized protein n=1 Tax=marine sediment metagenome TaxID=412755 RepID=A0A0F8Z269_9ZZZZ